MHLSGPVGRSGMNNTGDVAVVQAAMASIGLGTNNCHVDGRCSPQLEDAIEAFQAHTHIPVTGRIDTMSQTLQRLEQALPHGLRDLQAMRYTFPPQLITLERTPFRPREPSPQELRDTHGLNDDVCRDLCQTLRQAPMELGFDLTIKSIRPDAQGKAVIELEAPGVHFVDVQFNRLSVTDQPSFSAQQPIASFLNRGSLWQVSANNAFTVTTNQPQSGGKNASTAGFAKVVRYKSSEISVNLRSSEANRVRRNLGGSVNHAEVRVSILSIVDGFREWASMVSSGSQWDHKRKVQKIGGGDWTCDQQSKQAVFYDVWSNLHYGVVGRAVGFSRDTLLLGAAAAQFDDNSGVFNDKGDTKKYFTDVINEMQKSGISLQAFDDPFDQSAIKAGMDWWDRNRRAPSDSELAEIIRSAPGIKRRPC